MSEPGIRIAPSILSSDFSILGEECRRMREAGADLLHVDIMDGHFVPNLTIGPGVVRSLRPRVSLPLDVHLMVTDPVRFIGPFCEAGADIVTFHAEAGADIAAALAAIRGRGRRAGLVLKPATPAGAALPYLAELDVVMVMTVEPGFGGQKLIEAALGKVAELRAEARRIGRETFDIEVDGGINEETAPRAVRAGANVLVAGSALFGAADYAAAVAGLRRAARAGRAG